MMPALSPSLAGPIDAPAAAAKIQRLAAELSALCEAYGLDVPHGCDDSIPTLCDDDEPLDLDAALGAGRADDSPIDPPEPAELLGDALRANEHRTLGLVPIAAVVRTLEGVLYADAVHAELLLADRRGEIELRPVEPGELPADDEKLCPLGPRGSLLGFARPRARRDEARISKPATIEGGR